MMTLRHTALVLRVLLYVLKLQRAPRTADETAERDRLEKDLRHEIGNLGFRNQVIHARGETSAL
jgi:hypothetical protein